MIRPGLILLIGALIVFSAVAETASPLHKHGGGGSGGPPPGPLVTDEEFVGPFASWMCARTAASGTCGTAAAAFCNAAGNGIVDDTTAIQSCINSLGSSTPVVYFPCGTYNISTTLTIAAKTESALIGQDNSTAAGRCTTTLRWTGAGGGRLILINGTNFSQFSRLTFDGNSLANVLVDQQWDQVTGSFDSSNQYIDDVWKNGNDITTSYGYRCGSTLAGCSESSVVRGHVSNLGFGIATCNANALDLDVWYSKFSNTAVAISGDSYIYLGGHCGGGALHSVGSVFSGSSLHDIGLGGAGDGGDYLDNYSSGSHQFDCCYGFVSFQRNTIINTAVDGTAGGASIYAANHGLLLDNTIMNTNTTAPYVGGGYVVSIGNKYTNASPFSVASELYNVGGGDTTISYAPPAAPTLPGTLPNNNHTIYEAGAFGVQLAICKASNGNGSTFSGGACTGSPDGLKNVAHIPPGVASISTTVVVPANSNAQIIGDGWFSTLDSTAANPILQINGPSAVTLRQFHLHGNTTTPVNDAIRISGADQAGAYVYTRHMRNTFNSNSAVWSNGLANALVELDSFESAFGSATYDIIQTGGNHLNHFLGTGARVSISGTASGQLVGGWLEGNTATSTISGSGSFIHSGAFLGFGPSSDLFDLTNFSGTFAIFNSVTTPTSCTGYTGRIVNSSGTDGGLIASALDDYQRVDPILNSAGDTLKFFGNTQTGCVSTIAMPDSPSPFLSSDLSTVASSMPYFRATKPLLPNGNPSGTSAVEIYDILTEGFVNGLKVSP